LVFARRHSQLCWHWLQAQPFRLRKKAVDAVLAVNAAGGNEVVVSVVEAKEAADNVAASVVLASVAVVGP
jgi:hypothetical protein